MEESEMITKNKLQRSNFLRFILAGKALVTFRNKDTGNRYTYKIKKSHDGKVYFVSVLYGSDNTSSYMYIGVIRTNRNFEWTHKSKLTSEDIRVRVFKYIYRHIIIGDLDECVEIWHEGRCGRCGRILTVPESIESGIGPVCAKELN